MTTLTHFLHGADSSLGVFYPKHYIIAVFPTFETTRLAAQSLRKAGFTDDEMLTIHGAGILRYFEEFRDHAGLWAGVMAMLSRAFGTEQKFADYDIHLAQGGAGFLAVHSADQCETTRIKVLLAPFEPRAMHWYESGGIQCLI